MEVIITDQNFEAEVLHDKGIVLVDFWAPWCGPCQVMMPLIEELGKTAPANVKVGKLNVDENSALATQFGIMSIPTILVFRDGKVINRAVGVQSREKLLELIS